MMMRTGCIRLWKSHLNTGGAVGSVDCVEEFIGIFGASAQRVGCGFTLLRRSLRSALIAKACKYSSAPSRRRCIPAVPPAHQRPATSPRSMMPTTAVTGPTQVRAVMETAGHVCSSSRRRGATVSHASSATQSLGL